MSVYWNNVRIRNLKRENLVLSNLRKKLYIALTEDSKLINAINSTSEKIGSNGTKIRRLRYKNRIIKLNDLKKK